MFVFTDINTRLAPARVTSCYDSPPLLSSPLLSWAGALECWSVVPHINTTTPDCRVQTKLSTIDSLLTFIVHFRFVPSLYQRLKSHYGREEEELWRLLDVN